MGNAIRIEDDEGREHDQREPRHFSGVVSSFLAGEMISDRRRRYHATVLPTGNTSSIRSPSALIAADIKSEIKRRNASASTSARLASRARNICHQMAVGGSASQMRLRADWISANTPVAVTIKRIKVTVLRQMPMRPGSCEL